MADYIVHSSQLKPSKIKGELPDIFYTYIASDSYIGWSHMLTNKRENAYIFDESELDDAKFIASCWRMKVEKLK